MDLAGICRMTQLPFHPFLVRTTSGESYAVTHPERIWIDPEGELMLVKDKDQGVVLIDLEHISECVRRPAKPRSRNRADG